MHGWIQGSLMRPPSALPRPAPPWCVRTQVSALAQRLITAFSVQAQVNHFSVEK